MIVDYEKYKKEEVKKNIKKLRDNITDQSIMKKIRNWADKYDLTFEFVRHKVFIDDIFALNFVKDPGRQNFHENTAAYFLGSLYPIYEFELLPKGGASAKVINNGMLVSLKQSKESTSNPKTIDFSWIIKTNKGTNIRCYASHKYTKDKGGSQDNQYNDLKSFMQHAHQNQAKNTMFFAICDGKYYQEVNKETKKNKIEELNDSYFKANKLIALTIDSLYDELERIIEEL